MVAAERNHHVVAGGIDLVPLAVELGLGDRDARGSKPADDGDIEADVRASGAEAGSARDGIRSAAKETGDAGKSYFLRTRLMVLLERLPSWRFVHTCVRWSLSEMATSNSTMWSSPLVFRP